jgi:hypothetical protein
LHLHIEIVEVFNNLMFPRRERAVMAALIGFDIVPLDRVGAETV